MFTYPVCHSSVLRVVGHLRSPTFALTALRSDRCASTLGLDSSSRRAPMKRIDARHSCWTAVRAQLGLAAVAAAF